MGGPGEGYRANGRREGGRLRGSRKVLSAGWVGGLAGEKGTSVRDAMRCRGTYAPGVYREAVVFEGG